MWRLFCVLCALTLAAAMTDTQACSQGDDMVARSPRFQTVQSLLPGGVELFWIADAADDTEVTYAHAIRLFQTSAGFRRAFVQSLRSSGHRAFYWETPPITPETLSRRFEYVLVPSSSLARLKSADRDSFSSKFATVRPEDSAVVFPSLGGDALLVAPTPQPATGSCADLF